MTRTIDWNTSKNHKVTGTSEDAAKTAHQTASRLRVLVLKALASQPMTTDEVAAQYDLSVLSIRPRCSELRALGLIVKTGERRVNASGCTANVWRLA